MRSVKETARCDGCQNFSALEPFTGELIILLCSNSILFRPTIEATDFSSEDREKKLY